MTVVLGSKMDKIKATTVKIHQKHKLTADPSSGAHLPTNPNHPLSVLLFLFSVVAQKLSFLQYAHLFKESLTDMLIIPSHLHKWHWTVILDTCLLCVIPTLTLINSFDCNFNLEFHKS
jgi:hypothetical protein